MGVSGGVSLSVSSSGRVADCGGQEEGAVSLSHSTWAGFSRSILTASWFPLRSSTKKLVSATDDLEGAPVWRLKGFSHEVIPNKHMCGGMKVWADTGGAMLLFARRVGASCEHGTSKTMHIICWISFFLRFCLRHK